MLNFWLSLSPANDVARIACCAFPSPAATTGGYQGANLKADAFVAGVRGLATSKVHGPREADVFAVRQGLLGVSPMPVRQSDRIAEQDNLPAGDRFTGTGITKGFVGTLHGSGQVSGHILPGNAPYGPAKG